LFLPEKMRHTVGDEPRTSGPGSDLDFEKIRAEIDNLDIELRDDTAEHPTAEPLTADAIITKLRHYEQTLFVIVRRWRRPESVTSSNLSSAERIVSKIYELLEDDLQRFPSLWAAYRSVQPTVDSYYESAMDASSIFRQVLEAYKMQGKARLDRVGTAAAEITSRRRMVITAVRRFHAIIASFVEELHRSNQRADTA
jgi:hypothetical protein